MHIVRYEPFGFVNRFHRDFAARFFGENEAATPVSSAVAWLPSVDVSEEENRYVVQVDLPGVDSKDIEITAEKGVLSIKGARKAAESKKTDAGYERVERVAGTFLRRFTLPETAQTDAITAKQANGVLEVSIPKQAKVEPKKIEVQAA
jgi:HSP20 family protein